MKQAISNLLTNWKTTFSGIAMVVTGIVHIGYAIHSHGLTESDCTTTVLAIITGIGFIAAGDAGAPPPESSALDTTIKKLQKP